MRAANLGALALAFASTTALAETCPAERAVYRMQAEEGAFRAQLLPSLHMASAASDLYLQLTTPARSYWFTFSVSNGYGGIAVLPVSDPHDETARDNGPRDLLEPSYDAEEGIDGEMLATLRFFAMDSDLKVFESPPQSGDEAPPYLMMPDMGAALWYYFQYLSEDPDATDDVMPRGVFKLAECLEEAPKKAYP